MRLLVNWDADGDDNLDPNGEWVRITNLDPVNPLPLGGWWLRDSALRRLVFPSWAEVPPGGHVDDLRRHRRRQRERVLLGPAGARRSRTSRATRRRWATARTCSTRRATCAPPRSTRAARRARTPTPAAWPIDARPRGRESIQITNTGPVADRPRALPAVSKPYSYAFAPSSIVQPGETMRVRLYESGDEDSALTRYWATNGPILNNGGDVVELRRFDDVLLACTAWGSRSC